MSEQSAQTNLEPNIVLEVINLSVTIKNHTVILDASLTVPEMKITAVIGSSGCGKSVLLKSIVGILKEEIEDRVELIYSGQILYRGNNLLTLSDPKLEEIRQQITYVSQHPISFPGSILDNLVFALRYWKPELSKSELRDRAEQVAHQVYLWDEINTRLSENPNVLSAGQLQRLSIARALALEPDILLLDEPCAYIDPISTQAMEEVFHELGRKQTIVIVTHNMQQAARISDYSLYMTVDNNLSGQIVEVGETTQMFTRPGDRRTEDFITDRIG